MPTLGRVHYLEAAPRAGVRARGVLLLLHAFPLDARMWEPQLALADEGWRVIAPDVDRVSERAADARPPTMDDYAGDLVDLLDGLHIHTAVIGGLSMGGYAALALFRQAPRYVQALILCDTRAEADTPEAVDGRKKMLALVRDKGASAVADLMIPKLLGETTRTTRPDVIDRVRSLIVSRSTDSIADAINALMTRPDSTPLLSSIHCPTLVVVGEEDTVTPPPLSEKLRQGIAGAELVTVARAGHLSSVEQPDAFNATLARFLAHRV